MKTKALPICLAAALLVAPAAAQARYLVPPENSAAAQYTESFPTSGGNATPGRGPSSHRTPTQVLGSANAQRLESKGQAGQAAAQLAAATAPEAAEGAAQGNSSKPSVTLGAGHAQRAGGEAAPATPAGSSGVGQVVSHATGFSSSNQIGLLIPLVIAGALAWALAFALRRRRSSAA